MTDLSFIDWCFYAVYLAVVFGLAFRSAKGQQDNEDYFIGGRNMNWFVVGVSMFATSFSSISFPGLPQRGAQAVVLGTAIVAVMFLTVGRIDGGWSGFWAIATKHNKFQMFHLNAHLLAPENFTGRNTIFTAAAFGLLKFILGEGESVRGPIPPTGNTSTRGFFKPDVRSFLKRWVAEGPTHHFALGVGHHARTIQHIAEILNLESVIVTSERE